MVIFKDDDQDTLIKGLYSLKEALNEAKDLSYLEPGVFLAPFLEIIRSEETTGPVTSLALSAVNKIISYGLISMSEMERQRDFLSGMLGKTPIY